MGGSTQVIHTELSTVLVDQLLNHHGEPTFFDLAGFAVQRERVDAIHLLFPGAGDVHDSLAIESDT
jgi:hypothetical protein